VRFWFGRIKPGRESARVVEILALANHLSLAACVGVTGWWYRQADRASSGFSSPLLPSHKYPFLSQVFSVHRSHPRLCEIAGAIKAKPLMASSTSSISSEEWERWRTAIHTLYMLENLPLGGSSGVIETMKLRHGFCARQVPILLVSAWIFQLTLLSQQTPVRVPIPAMGLGEEHAWRELPDHCVKARQTESGRDGKQCVLEGGASAGRQTPKGIVPPWLHDHSGKAGPESRYAAPRVVSIACTIASDRFAESAAAGSPKTPPGVEICTPPPYPLFRRVFQELPILKIFRSGKSTFGKVTG
jgi:hypothetical protein